MVKTYILHCDENNKKTAKQIYSENSGDLTFEQKNKSFYVFCVHCNEFVINGRRDQHSGDGCYNNQILKKRNQNQKVPVVKKMYDIERLGNIMDSGRFGALDCYNDFLYCEQIQ